MKIKIKSLVCFQLYFIIIGELLVSVFHFPSAIRYLLDLNILILFVICFIKRKHISIPRIGKPFFRYCTFLAIFLTVFAVIRLVPFGQVIWALRNNFFYIFFTGVCTFFLDKDDAETIMDNFLKLQSFNVICALIEYFILNYRHDYTGGIFGVEQGCNAYLNVYLVFVATYSMTKYMYGKIKLNKLLYYMISALFVAVLSELKIFYLEIVLIFVSIILLSRKSSKTYLVIFGGVASLFLGLQAFISFNSESARFLYSLENALEYATQSDYGFGDIRIARLTAITQVNDYFFKSNFWLKLFGYGFGACEDSVTFSLFNSDFATQYGFLQYRNLSSSMLYLETGAIGLICFIVLFVILFRICRKNQRLFEENHCNDIVVFVQTFSIIVILMVWYNSAIRREIAYFSYFLLSVFFIFSKDLEKKGELK